MRAQYISYHSQASQFSDVIQSWFPAIHQKTFAGRSNTDVILAAAKRTAAR